ncbi:MAG: DNA-binding protein WhiA [Firmicutes bacterium]|nr:DNA-binding protein WhiA [Bacillota bacterium]
MSFSSEVKNELARIDPEKNCCQLADISGFLRTAGSLKLEGGGKFKIVVVTSDPAIARHYKKLIKNYFGTPTELEIEEGGNLGKGHRYMLSIGPEDRSEQILREAGILMVRQGNNYISDGIYDGIIRSKCCRKAYLRGMFLGSGTISDPVKAYHLEIVCNTKSLANDLCKMINSFVDLSAKTVERKGKYVVYMKKAAYISDTLAIMGAHSHVLKLEDVMIRKQMRGEAARATNCDSANTDRTLDAAEHQIEAIARLRAAGRFDQLPYKLREMAELREANPEASLAELGEMLEPPLKKSGVNNRLKKILDAVESI